MEIHDIIVKTEEVILESDLEVLLNDPFIENIVRYNHEFIESKDTSYRDPKHRNHIMLFVKQLYGHFKFLLTHIDDYENLVDYLCHYQWQNLRYMDTMFLYYEVPKSPVLELFFNRVHKQLDDTGVFSYSFDYKKKRFKLLSDSYVQLIGLPDTKVKMSGFIALEAEIKSVYLSKSFRDKGDDLMGQVEGQILKLQKLLELNLLPDVANAVPVPKKNKSVSSISSMRKSDFIKIISAMYDAKIFVNAKGEAATNKQKLMEDLGSFLNDDFSKYSASLSQAKNKDMETFLRPFREIEKAARRYFMEGYNNE